ncbi:M48 family metalloprotease [Niabella hibiscisoli]|uniref:M48 family metalloprotease n=1 Tax=Niabella hibiscisoli TaxID=1825928 RepID=UPI001F0E7BA4|nr:M48 family metallopeptidase [Niabella hibiscisoli]MCH5716608.1 M48 family metalloprotease [Niabella hibiscisoli]
MSHITANVSNKFKRSAQKSVFSIILFIIVYILLVIASAILAFYCLKIGLAIITNVRGLWGIIGAIGLMATGLIVFFFLFKFFFSNLKADRSNLKEIYQEDEPRLFEMIYTLAEQIGTDKPKKVYLAGDVNAFVFYDSTFLSLFFPTKKNLAIGIGLVNVLTENELKAVIAHEFGHFSQKTMKIGSYIYTTNRFIHNLLYENNSYGNAMQSIANIHGLIAVFVVLSGNIIKAIQWILRQLYQVLNINHAALSREMEFHADNIAAISTNGYFLSNALLRLPYADGVRDRVLNYYQGKIEANIKTDNIYDKSTWLLNFIATEENIAIKNGVPAIALTDITKLNLSKLNIEDQWASHPRLEDRLQNLQQYSTPTTDDSEIAKYLLNHIEDYQVYFSEQLFQSVNYEKVPHIQSLDAFQEDYLSTFKRSTLPKVFNGYYDNINPENFEFDQFNNKEHEVSANHLFSTDKLSLATEMTALANDKETLNFLLNNKEHRIKTFDYDGNKYKKQGIPEIIQQIDGQIESNKEKIAQNNSAIFQYFLHKAIQNNQLEQYKEHYLAYKALNQDIEENIRIINDYRSQLSFFGETLERQVIEARLHQLRESGAETRFQALVEKISTDELFAPLLKEDEKELLDRFVNTGRAYFFDGAYMNNEVQDAINSINISLM